MAAKAVKTYGLYNATFVRKPVAGTTVKQENWMNGGKLPSNKSSGSVTKFKK